MDSCPHFLIRFKLFIYFNAYNKSCYNNTHSLYVYISIYVGSALGLFVIRDSVIRVICMSVCHLLSGLLHLFGRVLTTFWKMKYLYARRFVG